MTDPHPGAARDGGAAFPTLGFTDEQDRAGMSLRDWFAGQALQGLIAGRRQFDSAGMWRGPSKMAEEAYALADAMLTERSRT